VAGNGEELGGLRLQGYGAGRRGFLETLDSGVDWKNPSKAGASLSEGDGRPELAVQSALRRGWVFGSQKFREKLIKMASGKLGDRGKDGGKSQSDGYHGAEISDHEKWRDGVLLRAGLSFLKVELEELRKARKGDERKGLLAEIVQAETTVRLDWIRGQLQMGTRSGCCRAIGLARERLKKDQKARKYRQDILKNATLND